MSINGDNIMKKNLICKSCGREMPNKEFKTKNGCIWCDMIEWNKNKQKLDLRK